MLLSEAPCPLWRADEKEPHPLADQLSRNIHGCFVAKDIEIIVIAKVARGFDL